jgi:hypothetical protein
VAMPTTKPMPPASRPVANGNGEKKAVRTLGVTSGVQTGPQRIVIYGPGGVGKSKLVSLLSEVGVNPLSVDVDCGTNFLDTKRVQPETWDEMLGFLQNRDLLAPYGAVSVDSGTRAEELATVWTLANVPHEKGHSVSSIEGYGFGKGTTHVFETFLKLLGALDGIVRMGKHAILVCHDCTATVPNPAGEDWIRWEPRLQSPASGKFSIRHRVKEWGDHLLFIGFDQIVDKEGKAKGSGSRTIYPTELPTHWAKSRSLRDTIPYIDGDPELWNKLFNKE